MTIQYDEDPNEYKKARKRIQNRESAIRSRNRKKQYFTELEVKLEKLETDNKKLLTENATLKAEKRLLSEQLEYFKLLVGNMNGTASSKGSTFSHARDNNSHIESYDGEKDILVEPNYDLRQGELPHIGNYQRPMAKMKIDTEANERLVLSRKDEDSYSNTAGLFFLAIVMCILCLTSLAMSGSENGGQPKREFTVDTQNRHLQVIKDHETTICFFKTMIKIILLMSVIVAFVTRISIKETKMIIKKGLIKCKIIKDDIKKTKYS